MAAQTTTELARVRYWQGQLLTAGDLQTQLLADEELRRLHNRAVHQAYGIAIGLTPSLEDGTFKLGCGMAYDCAGRSLVVETERTIPLPAQLTSEMTLVLAYEPKSSDGIALTWKPAQKVNANIEVALTRLIPGATKPELDPQFRAIVARPLARPRMATGNTIPGETPWQPWRIGTTEVGVKVLIDTSAAGFTREPHYFAEAIAGNPTANFIPAWFANIADPSAQGFTLQLMLRRITRESLDIADPKRQVAETPRLDQTITLNADNLNPLVLEDRVARLLPIAERAAVIKTLTGKNVTLEDALNDFAGPKFVAFGHAPRLAKVTLTSAPASFVEVTVDTPEAFNEGDVVVKLSAQADHARPAQIVSIDDTGTLELLKPITGLAVDDMLGIAQPTSTVQVIKGLEIKVAEPAQFSVNDLVVRLGDAVETSAPAKIDAKKADGTLVLAAPITNLQVGSLLGIARAAGKVTKIIVNASEVKIEVDDARQFRAGDLVAKRFTSGIFSTPVRVQRVTTNKNRLTLSGGLTELALNDTIAAADFPVRATVLGQTGTTLRVFDGTIFPPHAFVARIDELLSASLPTAVNIATGQTLTLDTAIANLTAGDVIGLCAFPAWVKVQAILTDGSIVVNAAAVLHEGDVVTALLRDGEVASALPKRTGIAIVAQVAGNVIRLVGTIPNLAVGDDLSVATIGGVVNVTPTASDNTKLTVDQPKRVRVGDFLADITGWRQAMPGVAVFPFVSFINGNEITLTTLLDGLLTFDTVGLTSLVPNIIPPLLQIRLNKLPTLISGDAALLVAFDRLRGETQSTSVSVEDIDTTTNTVTLRSEGVLGEFTFRPEDMSVGVLFVRGSALALIQQHDLFVSWLAVGEPDEMPKPCDRTDGADCPCTPA